MLCLIILYYYSILHDITLLHCITLYYIILHFITLYYTMLHYITLYVTMLYYIILCYVIILYYFILYNAMLYYIILYILYKVWYFQYLSFSHKIALLTPEDVFVFMSTFVFFFLTDHCHIARNGKFGNLVWGDEPHDGNQFRDLRAVKTQGLAELTSAHLEMMVKFSVRCGDWSFSQFIVKILHS